MTSTFPYFLVHNDKMQEDLPSIIVPSADGTYYKVRSMKKAHPPLVVLNPRQTWYIAKTVRT